MIQGKLMRIVTSTASPDPIARAFLLVVFLASVAIDSWLLRGLLRSYRSTHLKLADKTAVFLLSVGAILFLGALQFASLAMLLGNGPISMWPHTDRIVMEALAYTGIAVVLVGIVVNLKSSFR